MNKDPDLKPACMGEEYDLGDHLFLKWFATVIFGIGTFFSVTKLESSSGANFGFVIGFGFFIIILRDDGDYDDGGPSQGQKALTPSFH